LRQAPNTPSIEDRTRKRQERKESNQRSHFCPKPRQGHFNDATHFGFHYTWAIKKKKKEKKEKTKGKGKGEKWEGV